MSSTGSISGIVSGLDTESIVSGLMALKQQKIDNLVAQQDAEYAKESTWVSVSSKILTLQLSSYSLSRTASFDTKTSSVSDEDVLSITTSTSAVAGSYSFMWISLRQVIS